MSQFDESKLSRILARRIIAPEDRSQFLPMCTPIYCPDNNGVKASQVTIIDPNLNTFFDDADPTNTRSKYIGSQINSKATSELVINSIITKVGTPTIDDQGVVSNFSTSNYLQIPDNEYTGTLSTMVDPSAELEFTITSQNSGIVTLLFMHGLIEVNILGDGGLYIWNWESNSYMNFVPGPLELNKTYRIKAVISDNNTKFSGYLYNFDTQTYDVIVDNVNYRPGSTHSSLTIGCRYTGSSDRPFVNGKINLVNSKINEVSLATIKATIAVTKQPHEVQNIINIDLNKSVSRDYFFPYEVELKSDADIMSVIKSDFAAYFKNRVSNEIVNQLVLLHTTNAISTINKGASLAATLGDVISTFISHGTGQKFSIYKYNNGAPVVYSENSNQPNIDKDINQAPEFDMSYATKDDINVPALYYVEQPTLILPNTTFAEYQTALCNGDIKDYARRMINVETSIANFGNLGEGVFGTNDTFAVAFSSPSIKLVPDTNFYGYRLCCTMLYGVKLVHKHNLRLFI